MALRRTMWSAVGFPNRNLTTFTNKHLRAILVKNKHHFIFSCREAIKSYGKAVSQEQHSADNGTSFEEMIEYRRSEARKSVVVQVQSVQSCPELYTYCNQYGSVKSMHHYTLAGPSHFVLVEFGKEADVDSLLRRSGHLDSNQVVPLRSPFLWFRIGSSKVNKESDLSHIPLVVTDGNNAPLKNDLYDWMHEAENVSDQILILYEATKLQDLGSRLRFLTALQVEQALSGPFPKTKVYPFGSSVNGFGKMNCDLDVVLELDREEARNDCRLIFHAKNSLPNGRTQLQRHMEVIGDICQLFLPGCANIRRILKARVPIVKYQQDLTGVECDLSMTNLSAVYMSELLYVLGSVDQRVRPLVQAVRVWARDVGLTNPVPGRWITNFSLTLLVLFYLQQTVPHPVLPTLNEMVSLATPADCRITMEGINCTFIRDITRLCRFMDKRPKNTDSLEELLLKFFEFYCCFDFGSHAISLGTGTAIPKPEHAALYIANPLERGLNVSKNVSPEETERLRIEFRNAAWALDAHIQRPASKTALWGLVAICQAPKLQAKGQNVFYIPAKAVHKTRRLDVMELFEDELNERDIMKTSKSALKNKFSEMDSVSPSVQDMKPATVLEKKKKSTARRRKR